MIGWYKLANSQADEEWATDGETVNASAISVLKKSR